VSVGGAAIRIALAAGAAAAVLACAPSAGAARNGKIAFDVPGRGVYVTGPTGKGRRRVARSAYEQPAWSRKGRLALQRNAAGGDSTIALLRSGRFRAITRGDVADAGPAWSPDGRRVAFARALPGAPGRTAAGFDIYVARVRGGKLRRLTSDAGNDAEPAWSPNGRKIAFTSDRAGNQDVYVVRPNGRGLRRLTTTAAEDSEPAWSPNGRRIVFTSDREGNQDVYSMTARGRALRRLTRGARDEGQPAWSPDGRRIAYAVAGRGLYVMAPSGRRKRRLKGGRSGAHPDWRRR
jgi:Tol biopolymer transport system component